MGCDMHAHVEIKVKGQWHHYAMPRVSRNYCLFWELAGIRHNGQRSNPIAAGRGVPGDATFTTKFDYDVVWGADAHSPSWISDKECMELEERFKGIDVWCDIFESLYLFGSNITAPIRYPDDARQEIDAGYEGARIVFWFDN